MSKKEGVILKNYLKANGVGITEFAKDMGFTERQGFYYHLNKEKLDYDFKEKAAGLLGVPVEDIFSQMSKPEKAVDTEKEALRDLAATQKQLINYWKEALLAQGLRNEYAMDQVLQNQARILTLLDPALREKDPVELYTEMKTAVEDKLKKDHGRMVAG